MKAAFPGQARTFDGDAARCLFRGRGEEVPEFVLAGG
jgi:hypothetical protein